MVGPSLSLAPSLRRRRGCAAWKSLAALCVCGTLVRAGPARSMKRVLTPSRQHRSGSLRGALTGGSTSSRPGFYRLGAARAAGRRSSSTSPMTADRGRGQRRQNAGKSQPRPSAALYARLARRGTRKLPVSPLHAFGDSMMEPSPRPEVPAQRRPWRPGERQPGGRRRRPGAGVLAAEAAAPAPARGDPFICASLASSSPLKIFWVRGWT